MIENAQMFHIGELWSCASDGIRIWKVPLIESSSEESHFMPKAKKSATTGKPAEPLCLLKVSEEHVWCGCSDGQQNLIPFPLRCAIVEQRFRGRH